MIDPRTRLRDEMLAASDTVDEDHLPPRFKEARAVLRAAIARLESAGVPGSTVAAVMLSEALPRMAYAYGPDWLSAMLARVAENVRAGLQPN